MLEYFVIVLFPMTVLLTALFHDLNKGVIPDWLTYSAILIMLLYRIYTVNYLDYVVAFLFVVVGMTVLILLVNSSIGGGDLKLFVFLSLVVGFPAIGWLIFLTCLFAIFYSTIVKKKEVILAPSIFVAYLLIFIYLQHTSQWSIVLAG